ncbi:hypothetical protein ACP275_13G164400 [Erythranthe tilingii]
MQEAILYRSDRLPTAASAGGSAAPPPENINSTLRELVAENALVVFARKGCCMCHVVKLLLHGHGVNPTIVDIDEQNEADIKNDLSRILGGGVDGANSGKSGAAAVVPQFPAVFMGGELFGGLEEIMGAHISGELVPRLREARALWL